MDMISATAAFAALAQDTRLAVFRTLVAHEPTGLPAGEIARSLAVPHNTMSSHLAATNCAARSSPNSPPAALRRPPVADTPRHVLFLCTGNSARSILAEAILNREGGGRFIGHSAGSQPKGAVHPQALKLLRAKGFDTASLRSKSWDEFAAPGAPRLDYIFTVCGNAAAETCPVWPGHPATAHWGLPDPAAVDGPEPAQQAAFAATFTHLTTRIRAFLALPFADLPPGGLQARLAAIGHL
jgi:arsenate reductase